ncbi:MAG: succinylglutamate desuccinylase/aspartoacylase family protein [Saprospiraceae bacterium]
MKSFYQLFLLWISIFICTVAGAQSSFVFTGKKIAPGTKMTFQLPVSDGKDSTFIPVTVFNGAKAGPVLGITAGVHGYEYPPIVAAQSITQQLDPQELNGTIILVQIANVPSFLNRSPYVNPQDGKNLNRVFPGKADGTITERIAHLITQEIIAKSDYFLDMHGGDAPEDLRPYGAYYHSEAFPEASEKGKAMALAMGFDHIVVFNIAKERVLQPSVYCSQEAFHRKIPAVDIECGRMGVAGKAEVTQIEQAVFSLLRHLKMLPGNPIQVENPIIINQRVGYKSPHTGIFYPLKNGGDYVSKGMKVGYIQDFFGNHLSDVHANADGILIYIIGTPPVRSGEGIFSIGLIQPADN